MFGFGGSFAGPIGSVVAILRAVLRKPVLGGYRPVVSVNACPPGNFYFGLAAVLG